MSFEDIDFDIIVPGMITRGPAEVSFGEYLQTFSRALDERWNMVTTDFVNFPIPNIQFETGEIRNEVFWDKFRDLIKGYQDLWFGFRVGSGRGARSFYTEDVLIDPTNSANFLLTDAQLEAAMGAEAWDIFSDFAVDDRPFRQVFKASILQAFFTVYEFTNIIGKGSITDTSANQNRPTVITDSGEYFEADKVIGTAGQSYATVLSNLNWVQKSNGLSGLAFFEFDADRSFPGAQVKWQIRRANDNGRPFLRNKNGLDVVLQSKDLAGNILSMDFVSVAIMNNNISKTSGGVVFPDRPYDSDFVLKDRSGSGIIIESPIDDTIQTVDGTKQELRITSVAGALQPLTLRDETSTLSTFGEEQIINISSPFSYFVDINNAALEFFI